MRTHRLEGTDAFIVFDLDDAPRSVGVVRQAPKILVDGAQLLARSVTYGFASFECRMGGASAGVSAPADARTEALAAFVREAEPLVREGRLALDPGKGVGVADLAPLAASDPRNAVAIDGRSALLAAGVVAAAEVAGSLDGRRVAVEGFDLVGAALVPALLERGARIVAVGTAKGTASSADGFAADALAAAVGGDPLEVLGGDPAAPDAVLGAEADVLVAASKPGVVDHTAAGGVTAGVLVPAGPVPVTAKGLAVLRRAGVEVLPDFVTTAGPLIVAASADPTDLDAATHRVRESVGSVLAEVRGHEQGSLLAACYRAEAFLRTWQDALPFGRPLA